MTNWKRCNEGKDGVRCTLTEGHALPHHAIGGVVWPPLTKMGTDATTCAFCHEKFEMGKNVFTEEGKRETQISGMCERCFDDATKEPEEDERVSGTEIRAMHDGQQPAPMRKGKGP